MKESGLETLLQIRYKLHLYHSKLKIITKLNLHTCTCYNDTTHTVNSNGDFYYDVYTILIGLNLRYGPYAHFGY